MRSYRFYVNVDDNQQPTMSNVTRSARAAHLFFNRVHAGSCESPMKSKGVESEGS